MLWTKIREIWYSNGSHITLCISQHYWMSSCSHHDSSLSWRCTLLWYWHPIVAGRVDHGYMRNQARVGRWRSTARRNCWSRQRLQMPSVRNACDKIRNESETLLLVCNAYNIKPILSPGIKVRPFSGYLLDGYDSTTVERPSCKKQRGSEAGVHKRKLNWKECWWEVRRKKVWVFLLTASAV